MSITIKDIAQETGLSPSTISNYLNNKKIQKKNSDLIEEAIRRLDYHPNRIAQSLRAEHSRTVAILISDLGNYFWGDVIFAISSFFAEINYTVITCSYYYDPGLEKETVQRLIAKKVDGVIVLPLGENDAIYRILQKEGIPVVVLDQRPKLWEEYPVDYVKSDNCHSLIKAAKYLTSKKHQRIGILSPAKNSYTIAERIQVFEEVCAWDSEIELITSEAVSLEVNQEETMNMAKRHFRKMMQLSNPPTAVFCTNYIVAIGVLMEAAALGISIPEDVSVLTYDDDPIFRSMNPPITCMAQNLSAIGEEASKLLLKRMKADYSDFPAVKIIDTTFFERESIMEL